MLEKVNEILNYWFGTSKNGIDIEKQSHIWWEKDKKVDDYIKEHFEPVLQAAALEGKCNGWMESPRSCLALIILYDQLPRNMYRNTPQAFQFDEKALEVFQYGFEHKLDKDLGVVERVFFYMPLEHSENIDDQKLSVNLFRQLQEEALQNHLPEQVKEFLQGAYQYALQHYEIVEAYGRFPHRNSILKRSSTEAESEFLKGPRSQF